MTEEQFKLLMAKLEQILLAVQQRGPVGSIGQPLVPFINPGQCAMCGGFHGSQMCPRLVPISVCTGVNLQNERKP